MSDWVVIGPPASGKTSLCYLVAGLERPRTTHVTKCTSYLCFMVGDQEHRMWDTPSLEGYSPPAIASAALDICTGVIICYDGRPDWDVCKMVKRVHPIPCAIVITHENAWDLRTMCIASDIPGPTPMQSARVLHPHQLLRTLIEW